MRSLSALLPPLAVFTAIACAPVRSGVVSIASTPGEPHPRAADGSARAKVIARSRVWMPTDVATLDIKAGPSDPTAFTFGQTVECTYVKKQLSGKSPKFACKIDADDEVKVKYGGGNGEVYGEVAATRLLWALGFGADRMYPVKVICHDCPSNLNGTIRSDRDSIFDPATIERKLPGAAFHGDEGWSWAELEKVDEAAGGATRAQRDALKLIAVFMQHTDTKPQQQRLLCLDDSMPGTTTTGASPATAPPTSTAPTSTTPPKTTADTGTTTATTAKPTTAAHSAAATECRHPLMLLNDVGLTFGRANTFNDNTKGGMNLASWSKTPVWKHAKGCVGNLPKSMTGTLNDPEISEEGRQFLADLMMQLSDAQIHDLFEVSRAHLRLRDPGDVNSGYATLDEWVTAFKDKRDQIVNRSCSAT
jgi:hypothetical protein